MLIFRFSGALVLATRWLTAALAPKWQFGNCRSSLQVFEFCADKGLMTISRWLLAASSIVSGFAQHVGAPTDDLTKIGIDELFSVQVTSVGRKAEKQIGRASCRERV